VSVIKALRIAAGLAMVRDVNIAIAEGDAPKA
jgi:hypothetical protein